MKQLTLKLTPMVRWMMTFANHAERKKGVYSSEIMEQVAQRCKTAEESG